jgi:SAM-dependent methyltransferase
MLVQGETRRRITGAGLTTASTANTRRGRYRFDPATTCAMCGSQEVKALGRRLNAHQGLRPRRVRGVAVTVVQCRGCGLIFADPKPVPESLAQHYERPPETYWQEPYFTPHEAGFDHLAEKFRALWRGRNVPRALDVGAGIGKAMNGLGTRGFDTSGLEPSASFHERAIASGIAPGRLQLAAVEDAEYEPNSFDFILFSAVLEHLLEPGAAIERALGWLAPGGLVYAEVPSARWLLARGLNLIYRAQGSDYVTHLSPMHPPFHFYEFTVESFHRHGARARYGVVDQRVFPGETFMPWPLARLATQVMDATGSGMVLEVWLRR